MNLVTQSQFAKMAGVSAVAIHKALKANKSRPARLEFYAGTRKIDADSALAQAYLRNPSDQRLQSVPTIPPQENGAKSSKAVTRAITDVQRAQKEKLVEDKGLKEQQRISLEWKNKVRRGDYVSIDAINKTIMVFLDRWLNENERGFSAKYDEMERDIIAGDKGRIKIKQELLDWFRERAHIAKITTCEHLKTIIEKQSKR